MKSVAHAYDIGHAGVWLDCLLVGGVAESVSPRYMHALLAGGVADPAALVST